jgi:hypothetical protein
VHVKHVPFSRINELGGQLQAVVFVDGLQTKVGRQLHCLVVKFAVCNEFSTLEQDMHPKVLSTTEFGSGHSQVPLSELNTKDLRQPQESVVLTNPVPFFPFNVPQIKQLPFANKTEFEGQMQAGIFKVGVHI